MEKKRVKKSVNKKTKKENIEEIEPQEKSEPQEEVLSQEEAEKPVEIVKKNIEDLNGRFLHIKVGDRDRPASEEDIIEVRDSVDDLFKEHGIDNCIVYVSHHAVQIEVIR